MRPLAGSLADGVLTDSILIPPRPLIPPTNLKKVRGPRTKVRQLVTEKPFTSKWKKEMEGWLNASLKSTETRDELSTTCNPKVISRCLSAPGATSLHHCLKNKQLKLIWLQW